VAVVAFFYASQINDGAFVVKHEEPEFDLRVSAVGDGIVTLDAKKDEPSDLRREGTFGLEWGSGYGQVGKILDLHEDRVVREFKLLKGSLRGGINARLDSFAFDGDPSVRGIPFADVMIDTPLGPAPAWQTAGSGETWVVLVHGKDSSREEALRILPAIRDAGLPALVITYRNDEGSPASSNKRYGYGHDEWQDVAAAMDYGRSQGARRFVLYGYSMGGAIVLSTLEQRQYSAQVAGVILDAPMLNLKKTVDFRARLKHLPRPLTMITEELAARRYDIDWQDFDYLSKAEDSKAEDLRAPVLLFHGDADKVIPTATSDDLAQRRSDIVTYRRVAGAGHTRSWNADPAAYETVVREFLTKLSR
jgi:pimeloyl-ACP methyl ester carboxylesterase